MERKTKKAKGSLAQKKLTFFLESQQKHDKIQSNTIGGDFAGYIFLFKDFEICISNV
jgi:hypothetical protein